ncbi:alkaline phosphatase [Marinicella meishanensis]|uniref:alkaline phosphatase n=1 Tax=Marinicella meishanensis TaxID=2873263 RepID=UPI001CBDB423|nr:alkaline phosphatase [Marinicella sp. NBU2979]
MNDWKKISALSLLFFALLLALFIYLFKINISLPSNNLPFVAEAKRQTPLPTWQGTRPKNIIVFIADGMGFSHLTVAMHTQQQAGQSSVWQQFEVKTWHDARSHYGPLTDSEAAATAMATGHSTAFGHIGMDAEQNHLSNVFELASAQGMVTGVVTDSYVWDGTPAGFTTHIRNEDDARNILKQQANSQLALLFGELEDLGEGLVPEQAETESILSQRFQLLDKSLTLPAQTEPLPPIAVLYDEDEIQNLNSSPNLPQMTATALQYLSWHQQPMLLLVESEELDSASHTNDADRVIAGLQVIQHTLAVLLQYTAENPDTLLVFTADHETGGLAATADYTTYPDLQMRWSTRHHTAVVVPLLATGPGAQAFTRVQRNTDIGLVLKDLLTPHEATTTP